jgi:hypothetical protein
MHTPLPPTPPLLPRIPRLPPRRVSAALTALTLAAGIALGALIGPGPAASLASGPRAAALERVLALLALRTDTGGGGKPPSSAAAPQPTPASPSEATSRTGSGGAGGGSTSSSSSSSSTSSSHASGASEGSVSPTSPTTPAAGGREGKKAPPAPLPPIANVWLVVLPYGGGLESVLKQSTAAPYLDGQLAGQGTVLSGWSSLAAEQLAGDATLLSGQVGTSVNTIAPPPSAQSSLQAEDAFLQEVVPKIVASAAYTEHGLIVVAFGAANPPGTPPGAAAPSTGTATAPSAGTTEAAGQGISYPAGTLTSTLTASGPPAGALLLSPFLRRAGARTTAAFDPLSPRASLERLFQTKAAGG